MGAFSEKLSRIELIGSHQDERHFLESCIKEKAYAGDTMQILEAGCGRGWMLDLKGFPHTHVGVDVDEHVLRIRKDRYNDLHESILGDLRTIDLEESKYDVIYSSFVLEHIDDAERVLHNFVRWLKPDGILILRIPDRDSAFGFITRLTPHWVHVLYKRYIRRRPNAGKPGYGPFPVVYDEVVSRKGMHEFCRKSGLMIKSEYGSNHYLKRMGIFSALAKFVVNAISLGSFGNLAADHNYLIFVMEKGKKKPQ